MHLQFIGCGDAFGSGGRFNTCFHLVGRNINALIDCGASSLVSMNKLAINRNDIDTIFISHFHADHFGGLPFFMLEANYILKRQQPLTIAGPPGGFTSLREAAVAVDRVTGEVYVVDDLQPADTETWDAISFHWGTVAR